MHSNRAGTCWPQPITSSQCVAMWKAHVIIACNLVLSCMCFTGDFTSLVRIDHCLCWVPQSSVYIMQPHRSQDMILFGNKCIVQSGGKWWSHTHSIQLHVHSYNKLYHFTSWKTSLFQFTTSPHSLAGPRDYSPPWSHLHCDPTVYQWRTRILKLAGHEIARGRRQQRT